MTPTCTALPQGAGFVSSIASYIDCQAQALGSGAWAALSMPGSSLSIVLTGFLTILIALIGYNLLLGHAFTVREGTVAAVKIGAIFALATSWPAYRTLVYDLVTNGPAQLVAEVGPPAGVVGSDGTLMQRLDGADHALAQLSILGPGPMPQGAALTVPAAPFSGFDSFALGGSRILFLVTSLASLGAIRVVTGLLLALGPFFIAFLMFDSTRSLFEGWIRVLAGAALAAVGVSIALGLELAFLEPWLSDVLARRLADEPLPTMPAELFVITMLFTVVVVVALRGAARAASAFRLPVARRAEPAASNVRTTAWDRTMLSSSANSTSLAERHLRNDTDDRSRASAMAGMFVTMTRREDVSGILSTRVADAPRPTIIGRQDGPGRATPVGRTFARRAAGRVSGSATKRDSAA